MNFDQVILSGHRDIVLFDRNDPLSSPYVSRTIDGLGPTEANVNVAQDTAGAGIYLGRRPSLREVVCNIHMNPDYTIGENPQSLRERLYFLRPITPDGSLLLKLMWQGAEVVRTAVYIKRIEVSPFTKDNIIQLVLAALRDTLEAPEDVVLTNPNFDKTNPILPNIGSAPTGFHATLKFTGSMFRIGFSQNGTNKHFSVARQFLDNQFVANDILEIDTRIGSRGVWLTRAGVKTSLLGFMDSQSTWLTLDPAETALTLMKRPEDSANFNWTSFRYRPQYLGV